MPSTSEALLPRICVRAPYFALRKVEYRGSELTAEVPVEQPLADEVGPMAAAEAGRHMAIMGLSAVAMGREDPSRSYYLAHRAVIERTLKSSPGRLQSMVGRARGEMTGPRSATATVGLGPSVATPLFALTVDYHVLSEKMFERVFRKEQRETSTAKTNPYLSRIELVEETSTNNEWRGFIAKLKPEQCDGHFPGCPALPVAFLMSALSEAAGRLFGRKYIIERGTVISENLAFAGDTIDIVARRSEYGHFFCRAMSSRGHTVGELEVTLSVA